MSKVFLAPLMLFINLTSYSNMINLVASLFLFTAISCFGGNPENEQNQVKTLKKLALKYVKENVSLKNSSILPLHLYRKKIKHDLVKYFGGEKNQDGDFLCEYQHLLLGELGVNHYMTLKAKNKPLNISSNISSNINEVLYVHEAGNLTYEKMNIDYLLLGSQNKPISYAAAWESSGGATDRDRINGFYNIYPFIKEESTTDLDEIDLDENQEIMPYQVAILLLKGFKKFSGIKVHDGTIKGIPTEF